MYTITNILNDLDRGCMIYNLNENCFSYRIIYFSNEQEKSTKHYIDTTYGNLRKALEIIIKKNLSTTNTIVISAVVVRINKKNVSLLSRSYGFCLNEYFDYVTERYEIGNKKRNTMYGNTCPVYLPGLL